MSHLFSVRKPALALFLILPGLYISDLIYGLVQLNEVALIVSPGQVLRGTLYLFSIYYILTRSRYLQLAGGERVFIVVLVSWPFLVSMGAAVLGGFEGFPFNISYSMKCSYLIAVAGLFLILINKFKVPTEEVLKYIEYTAYFVGISLFLMKISDFGISTYGDYSSGFKGVFHAQNDISLSLLISLPVALYRVIVRPGVVRIILFVLAFYAMSVLGTRASMLGLVIVPLSVLGVLAYSRSSSWKHKRKAVFFTVISPIVITAISAIAYFSYLEATRFDYQQAKIDRTMGGELGRSRLLQTGLQYTQIRPLVKDLFGEGAYSYQSAVYHYWPLERESGRIMVEMDWYDLYGAYGAIYMVAYYFLISYWFLGASVRFVRTREPTMGVSATMILLYLGHSAFAGHAIVSPTVSTLIAAVLAILHSTRQKR